MRYIRLEDLSGEFTWIHKDHIVRIEVKDEHLQIYTTYGMFLFRAGQFESVKEQLFLE